MTLIEFISKLEGRSNIVYKDNAGFDTIGVGHLLTHDELVCDKILIRGEYVDYINGLTEEQIDALLLQDIHPVKVAISVWVKVPLVDNQQIALISFAFNVGIGNFRESTLLFKLNQGKYTEVPFELKRWVKSWNRTRTHKIINRGLVYLREQEVKMWNGENGS
jgi:lysozyme